MDLQKFIPVAAGMAGGSSDAAAAMIGVNRLFGLGLTVRELMERSVKVGADVPYCLLRGTALAEGIGEKLRALPPCPDCYVLMGSRLSACPRNLSMRSWMHRRSCSIRR